MPSQAIAEMVISRGVLLPATVHPAETIPVNPRLCCRSPSPRLLSHASLCARLSPVCMLLPVCLLSVPSALAAWSCVSSLSLLGCLMCQGCLSEMYIDILALPYIHLALLSTVVACNACSVPIGYFRF